jgi:hypothetical protein
MVGGGMISYTNSDEKWGQVSSTKYNKQCGTKIKLNLGQLPPNALFATRRCPCASEVCVNNALGPHASFALRLLLEAE